jgi:hypothetical protein
VRDAVRETYNDDERRNELKDGNNVFRAHAKTRLTAGIITNLTAHVNVNDANMKEHEAEDLEVLGAAAIIEGIEGLRRINDN